MRQLSSEQHIFGKRDNSLLLESNYRRRWLIQASVSSKKSFTSWFYEVLIYFFPISDSNTYFFKTKYCHLRGLCILLKEKHKTLS